VPRRQYRLHHLLKGVAWIGASGVCGRTVAFAASIVVAHALGPAAFGVLAFGLSIAIVFGACASLGLDELLVREIARNGDNSGATFADALILRLAATPIAGCGVVLLAVSSQLDARLGVSLTGYALLNSCLLSACAAFRGRGRMDLQALLIGGQAVLVSLLAVAVALSAGAVDGVGAAYVAGTAVVVCVAYWLLARTGAQPRFGWRPRAWASLACIGAPFAVGAIGLLALDRMALTTITIISGSQAAGWFGAVHAIILALSGVATTAMLVAFPLLARAHVHDPRAASALVRDLLGVALALGCTLSLALYLLAPVGVPLLFGSDYLASVAIMQRIAFSLPFVLTTIVLVGACEATDRQTLSARAIATALPLAGLTCIGATWLWGYEGGAAAYTLSHAVLAGVLAARWFLQPQVVLAAQPRGAE